MRDYLYHYTSVETLALILKHKTLRFSNLTIVDDLEEQRTKDFGDFGRFCFVSCWTRDPGESIPLWNMYTPKMSGVRIRLPENPFANEILSANDQGVKEDIVYNKGLMEIQNSHNVIVFPYKAELFGVTYTEDVSLLNPNIFSGDERNFTISTKDIGRFKNISWSFQKEQRYKVMILPISRVDLEEMLKNNDSLVFNKLKSHILPITYLDLHLDKELFKDMEILCGPKMSEAQKIIVENLVEKYNPSASIKMSSMKIK